MVSALARAGWLVDSRFMLYGIAGWTGARFDYQNLTDNDFFQPQEQFWANGATFGGGGEYRFGTNWSLRAEYRYTHFEDADVQEDFFQSSTFPFNQSNTINASFENEMHVGRLGIAYLLPVR
jgi:outer membrane immunogenic protein